MHAQKWSCSRKMCIMKKNCMNSVFHTKINLSSLHFPWTSWSPITQSITEIFREASIIAWQVETLPGMPTCHKRMLVSWLLHFWPSFLLVARESSRRWPKRLDPCTHVRLWKSLWLLASPRHNPGHCGHPGSEPANGRSFSFSLCNSFKINKS